MNGTFRTEKEFRGLPNTVVTVKTENNSVFVKIDPMGNRLYMAGSGMGGNRIENITGTYKGGNKFELSNGTTLDYNSDLDKLYIKSSIGGAEYNRIKKYKMTTPKEVAEVVFKIFKNKEKFNFINTFMTIEDYRENSDNSDIVKSKEAKEEFLSITEKELNKTISQSYKECVNPEFDEIPYEELNGYKFSKNVYTTGGGVLITSIDLKFKVYEGTYCSVSVSALKIDNQYKITYVSKDIYRNF